MDIEDLSIPVKWVKWEQQQMFNDTLKLRVADRGVFLTVYSWIAMHCGEMEDDETIVQYLGNGFGPKRWRDARDRLIKAKFLYRDPDINHILRSKYVDEAYQFARKTPKVVPLRAVT